MNVLSFQHKKQAGEKFSMITCYDAPFAKVIAETDIDCVLVGDTVSMVVHGHPNTLHATTEMMALHTAAVRRGAPKKFIIGDLPFLSYRKGLVHAMEQVELIMRAGANAIKLENGMDQLTLITHIVDSGVPVMGHLGLTPQSIHGMGGHKVQGKTPDTAKRLKQAAQMLADAGCFAIVLECIPPHIAAEITKAIHVPTIGIGAGPDTDGQVLVLHDMLGFSPDFSPKFLKQFAQGFSYCQEAIQQYHQEVTTQTYPTVAYAY